ncbi:pitrilysin family protein [Sphingomonas sp. CFBP8993]|uniref:M16 family metallopeptidase n=1 Tax=Sphingomonas sp. CFBP8993 TaxID=3096526 RepID=UPI002A6A8DA6|nr:pitrilysin family protein [Sphingomonas sp. CFBP8993]MDY0957231.1 pitrilysin family protein [Sphingomonas sp. CFBP8993]
MPAPQVADVAFERFTLPNGLTALVHTDHSSPSVFVGLWYKTGSRDEPPGKTGFAHLFEHLMFQSTAHRPQEYMAALNAIGAVRANGMTRTDDTVYFETVPTNALDSVLWLESDRMGYLDGGITQALLDEQRRVVLNEKRQGELRPEEMAWRHFLTAFYPAGHPYAHPTIGSTEDIEGATLDDVKHWFQGHYGAGNAVLVLSGDIDAATAREKITRYFGAIRPGTPISRPLQWTPSLTETRRDRLYGDFAQTSISRSWPIPNTSPRDTTLLLLAARAMAGPKDAPLVRALVTDAKVATGVTATVNESALGSVLNLSIGVRPGVSPEVASRALDAALADYATKGPPPSRLQSIIAATDASLLRSLDDNAAVGNRLGEGEVAHGDPAYFLKQRTWINDARPDEVRAVAAKWLTRPYYEMITMPVPDRQAGSADVDRSHMPAPGPFKSEIAFPPVTTMTLANGLKLVVARRPGTATVDLGLQFATGTQSDPGIAADVVTNAFHLLGAGAKTRAGEPVEQRLSQLGIQLGAQAGPWNSGVRWSVANNRLDDSFALVADLVRHPAYPATAVEEARATTLSARGAEGRNPFAAAMPLLNRAIWGDHDPRGHVPTTQDADTISRQHLVDYQAHHIVPGDATLYVVGDVTPDRAKALAERYFGTWTGPATHDSLPVPVAPTDAKGPHLILVDAPGAPQSSIAVGTLIPPFDKDRSAIETITAATLANIGSGRLNANLRQDKGWSYGFGGEIQDAPSGDRLFVARGTVQADRTADSLAELRREFSDFAATRPPTQAELDAQRNMMIRAATLRYSRNEAFLDSLETSGSYKLPYDRPNTLAQRLNAVTLGEVQDSARRLVRPDALTWVVIGDLRTIEPQIRALGLAPVEVWDVRGRKLR